MVITILKNTTPFNVVVKLTGTNKTAFIFAPKNLKTIAKKEFSLDETRNNIKEWAEAQIK